MLENFIATGQLTPSLHLVASGPARHAGTVQRYNPLPARRIVAGHLPVLSGNSAVICAAR